MYKRQASSSELETASVEFGTVLAASSGEHPIKAVRPATDKIKEKRSAIVIVEEASKKYSKR